MTPAEAKDTLLRVNREIAELTGLPPAELFFASPATDADGLFLWGVVGAARTGKSTLLHGLTFDDALAPGRRPQEDSARPVAYVYRPDLPLFQARPAQKVAPARVLPHDNPDLAGRVFLDFPDPALEGAVDSVRAWRPDLQGVIWVLTDTTYADRRFHDRLRASFKDPGNLSFVFNRIDHVLGRQGATPAVIRDELFQTLSDWLPDAGLSRDRVYAVCARTPEKHDLSRLRRDLFQRAPADLREGKRRNVLREIAVGARLLREHFGLDTRVAELRALLSHLPGMVEQEAGTALREVQRTAGSLTRPRQTMAQTLFEHRLRPWPVLGWLAEPVLQATAWLHRWQRVRAGEAVADYHALPRLIGAAGLPARLESVGDKLRAEFSALFAALAVRVPGLTRVPAESLAASLASCCEQADRDTLALLQQRYPPPGPRVRWLALAPALWFPVVQPLLEAALAPAGEGGSLLYVFVRMLGVVAIVQTAASVTGAYLVAVAWLFLASHRAVLRLRQDEGPYRAALIGHLVKQLALPYATLLDELRQRREQIDQAAEPSDSSPVHVAASAATPSPASCHNP